MKEAPEALISIAHLSARLRVPAWQVFTEAVELGIVVTRKNRQTFMSAEDARRLELGGAPTVAADVLERMTDQVRLAVHDVIGDMAEQGTACADAALERLIARSAAEISELLARIAAQSSTVTRRHEVAP